MKCPTTGKTMFAHKRDAQTFLNCRKDGPPMRTYCCPDCNEWHVTKKMNDEPIHRNLLNLPITHINDFKKYIE